MSACEKDETEIAEASELVSMGTWDSLETYNTTDIQHGRQALKLYMYFVNGQYNEKEHYLIYDFDSLIADVGGYMGLLLGMSLQGTFEIIEEWWHKLALKRW